MSELQRLKPTPRLLTLEGLLTHGYIDEQTLEAIQELIEEERVKMLKQVQFGIARTAYKRTRAEIHNRPNITTRQIIKWLDNQIERLTELEAATPTPSKETEA